MAYQRREITNERGPDNGYCGKDDEISKKHGNTLVSTLRKIYGQGFGMLRGNGQAIRRIATVIAVGIGRVKSDSVAVRLSADTPRSKRNRLTFVSCVMLL